jgi:hypothetical protein
MFCLGFFAASLAATGSYNAQANEDLTGYTILAIVGFLAMITSPAVLMLGLIAGFAMRSGKKWARMTGIITAVFSLVQFPIGTLFGIGALRFLLSEPVKDFYALPDLS